MAISAADVKKLRDQTGAGMMDCKAALEEAHGNFDDATTILRKKGLASAAKKAGRATNEGLIGHRVSATHSTAASSSKSIASPTSSRGRDDFQQLIADVIAAIEDAGDSRDRHLAEGPQRARSTCASPRPSASSVRTWPCRASCATPAAATSASTSTWAASSACRWSSAA